LVTDEDREAKLLAWSDLLVLSAYFALDFALLEDKVNFVVNVGATHVA
jgi:hypothetical protein